MWSASRTATGECVVAFVVLRQGQTATGEEIREWAKDPEHGLTGYRAPKRIEFRDSLPETLVGKVLRRVLLGSAEAGRRLVVVMVK